MIRMTPILPKGKLFDAAAIARAADNALEMAAKDVKVDFDVTTQTWRHRPAFTIERSPGQYIVGTDDEIYQYVDEGTRPHVIVPRSARILRFRYPFRAKTVPRAIRSNRGSLGSNVAFAKRVNHPGTAAREFAETIAKKWEQRLPEIIQRAINAEGE